MSESINKPQRGNVRPPEATRAPVRTRVIVAAATMIAMALAAVVGGSSAYCSSVGGALFWSLFVAFMLPVSAFVNAPGDAVMVLVACVAVVLALARWWPLRFNFGIAMLAVVASGIASAAITSFLTYRQICTLM